MNSRLTPNEICPCGTGLTYGECCWDNDFEWVRDSSGCIGRLIQMKEEVKSAVESAEAAFFRVFERTPGKNDPVFVIKYLFSESDIIRDISEGLEKADARPELIYAFKKTNGLLVSDDNYESLTTQDREDWSKAIAEYHERKEQGILQSPIEAAISDLDEELDNMAIVFGYVLEHGYKETYEHELSYSSLLSLDEYALICAERSFKTLRSIRYLLDKGIGTDSLALCRSIYESYLHIAYVMANPERMPDLVDALQGLKLGTHEYKKTQKGQNRRIVVCKLTGAEYRSLISRHTMACENGNLIDCELFDSLYEFLSEFTHTGFSIAYLSATEASSLDPLSNGLDLEALFYATCFSILILDKIRQLEIIRQEAVLDIGTVIRRARKRVLFLIDNVANTEEISCGFQLIRRRLNNIQIP